MKGSISSLKSKNNRNEMFAILMKIYINFCRDTHVTYSSDTPDIPTNYKESKRINCLIIVIKLSVITHNILTNGTIISN